MNYQNQKKKDINEKNNNYKTKKKNLKTGFYWEDLD